jgi:hypothetical protein
VNEKSLEMKIKVNILLLLVVAVMLAGGCKYDWIIPEEVPIIDPDDPSQIISFSEQIMPIFTSGNNCTACHDGSPRPDLRAGNAYAALNNTRYLNLESPEESLIYTLPHPSGNHFRKYTATQAALILAWIQQGAENN